MYVPSSFREDDPRVLHGIVGSNGFGLLVTASEGLPEASSLLMLLDPTDPERPRARGTCRRSSSIEDCPHAYVSPRWYTGQRNVPSWDYVAVHVWGVPRLIENRDLVRDLLNRMMTFYESAFREPRSFDSIPADYAERLLGAIVAFELPITRIAGARKLSQNTGPVDRARIAEGLRATGAAADAAVADLIQDTLGAAGRHELTS